MGLPMPFERARTLLAKGRLHRRRKEKRLADETLHAALAEFEALGAAVWAGQARAELARAGRRPRAPDKLTETEQRVAELAAAGLTSRQIAEQAFIAPKRRRWATRSDACTRSWGSIRGPSWGRWSRRVG